MSDANQAEQMRLLIEANKDLYDKVEFGMETKAFLCSKLGQHLIQRAEEERDAAIAELVNVSPRNSDLIEQLQSVIKRAESIQYWMAEIIDEGHGAQETLMAQDNGIGEAE